MTQSRIRRTVLLCLPASLLLLTAVPASAAVHQVQVAGTSFTPQVLNIQAGDSVTWSNSGGVHNVAANNGSFRCANGCDGMGGNGNPASNAWSFTLTFNQPGTIGYNCEVHVGIGMVGTINVQGGGSPGSLQFSSGGYSVGEGGGSATITVQRVGGSSGTVSVSYATGGGTAAPGSDYTAASGTLSWGAGVTASRTFTVPVIDDSLDEGNETVNLTLSNPTGGASLGSPSQATLTIADNDTTANSGVLRFSTDSYSADEGAGSATITVQRVMGDDGGVSVDYTTGDGTATAGSDYTAASGTLSWPDNDDDPRTFEVPIFDDSVQEGNETVQLSLSNPGGGAGLGTPDAATLTLVDDDAGPLPPCVEDDVTLCFLDNRFQVRVDWRRPNGATGDGQAVPFTNRAGLFYFFNESNLEMLVKMVDACTFNQHFWVFFAATTNVEYTLTVTDTDTGLEQEYFNPLGMPALPEQDLTAFATCP